MNEYFRFSRNRNGIARVVFDHKGQKINTLSTPLMMDLEALLIKIGTDASLKALVFESGKPGVFIAGADLNEVAGIKSAEDARAKSRQGQRILARIGRLPFPSVAVIDGACLGGGLELALSCDFRLVSDNTKTRLGLPEVTLGIIPGFGGTRRLPRLIGLRRALPMILSGRPVDGPRAFKLKLADALYPAEFMAEKTGEFLDSLLSPSGRKKILKKRRRRCSSGALFGENPLARAVIFAAAKKQVLKKTGGHYAAPLTALKVVRRTCRGGERRALQAESRAFAGLAVSDVAKNLISLFFTGEALKKEYAPDPKKKSPPPKPLSSGAVLGAGTMGGGIAWLFSNAGVPVVMKDIYQQAVANAYAAVHSIYNDLVRLGRLERRLADLKAQKVSGRTDFRGFDRADFIVEAIVEDRTIKLKALAGLEAYCRPDAVIGTNTSSLSVNELARALKHPERFIGFHFFNPVNRMYLVEVVPGAETSPDTLARAVGYARELGKTPIVVGDCHGFLVNRVLMAYLNEALLLLEEGYDFTLVDRLAVGFGMPMGPFALLDEIGIGVAFKVAHILASAYKGRMETGRLASAIEAEKTLSGRQGGKGFYLYEKKSRPPNPRIAGILKSQGIRPARGRDKDEILKRMLLRMVNEAALCLEEGIIQKAEYLDLAMIYGTGFPPFRGGILRYADSLGIGTVISLMKRFEEQAGGRFTPGALLKEMEKKKRGFYS